MPVNPDDCRVTLITLGLNAYHADSSACLVRDGVLLAAAEEERFRRVKHWAGFPRQAIEYCLREAGVTLQDVEVVATNSDPRASVWRKIAWTIANRPDPTLVLQKLANRRKRSAVRERLAALPGGNEFRGEMRVVEHHRAHLASAFLVSPFEEAIAVSVDGFGDFASTAWGLGVNNRVSLDGRVYFPHSLGIFYETITQFLGFKRYGDEYKVMGLSSYGRPRYLDAMRRIVNLEPDGTFRLGLDYFLHHRRRVEFRWDECEPTAADYYTPELIELLGPPREPDGEIDDRCRDIAASAQVMYEEAFFHLLNTLYERYRCESLALAGGCAFNSVANGKIYERTPLRRAYIQSAAGDAGGAIGAAFSVWAEEKGGDGRFRMDHAFWGPAFDAEEIDAAISERKADIDVAGCTVETLDEQALIERTAQAIADGRVVGWFQGRMEWGPRALGNRSIVCDPRRRDMKDILNLKIKRRESFRPFAPAILRHRVAEWFDTDDDVPFMMKVFRIREEKRGKIPAVTHVDGTGRLQTVERDYNPRYFDLIETFGQLTGVPVVLNTSFNENEPVVCTPAEALDCFIRTKMDVLVMGDRFMERAMLKSAHDSREKSPS